MSALLARGLADRARGLLIWSLAVGLTGALFALVWPSLEGSVGAILEGYPEALKQAFGIETLSSAEEYLNAELFSLILPIALAILALRTIATTIAAAEERGYLDVLLSAPVPRGLLVAAAMVMVAVEAAAILLAGWALTCLAAAIVGADLSPGLTAAGYANVWPLAVFSAGVAVLLTGLTPSSGTVTGASAGVVVAMYVVDLLGRLSETLEPLRSLSVFRYYGRAGVEGLDPLAFAGVTIAGLLLASVGAHLFARRDLSG